MRCWPRVDRKALRIDRDAAKASLTAARSQLADDQASGAADVAITLGQGGPALGKSSLTSAKDALADAALRSTISGTVASVDLAVGDQVSGSSATGRTRGLRQATDPTAQVVVITTDQFVVNASVGAADLAIVKKGLQAQITPTGDDAAASSAPSARSGIVAESIDLRHRRRSRSSSTSPASPRASTPARALTSRSSSSSCRTCSPCRRRRAATATAPT